MPHFLIKTDNCLRLIIFIALAPMLNLTTFGNKSYFSAAALGDRLKTRTNLQAVISLGGLDLSDPIGTNYPIPYFCKISATSLAK
jgi:hypothetical protein